MTLAAAQVALWAAAGMWLAIQSLWIPLRQGRASRLALAIVGAAALAVPGAALVATLVRVYPLVPVVLAVTLLVVLRVALHPLAMLTGGWEPAELRHPVLPAIAAARRHLDAGDFNAFEAALKEARTLRTSVTARYVDLWFRFTDEERRRRAGERISSADTADAIAREWQRVLDHEPRPSRGLALAVALVAGLAAATPPYLAASARPDWFLPACVNASAILDRADGAPIATTPTSDSLPELVLADPGMSVNYVRDTPLDLDAAARSRSDPNAGQKLESAGFSRGYERLWYTPAGREIKAEIFEFGSPAGAATFHRQITDYGCQYANSAFEADEHAVGQQIRHAGREAIVEQVAWVDGSRRILVSVSFLTVPADHSAVLELAARAVRHYRGDQ